MLSFTQYITETAYGELDVAKSIITTLRSNHHQAYLVGGCVRDTLLHRTPKDYDVATDATPDQVTKLFPEADKVGAHFGVVIERGVEIATFRSDGAYGDGRRPDAVQFETDPAKDASRRDFTVNAMFMDPFSGKVVDHFGGTEDIKNKLLRCVGNPHQRFGEDYLRMLRAMRFSAKLGFDIHPDTFGAMKDLAHNVKSVAPERITQELTGALEFPGGPAKSFSIMHQSGMLAHVLPEVDSLPGAAFHLTKAVLDQTHHESVPFALAAMLCQVDRKAVERAAKRLKLSNDVQNHVLRILGLQSRMGVNSNTGMDELKRTMRMPCFDDALKLYGFRVQAHDPHVSAESFHFLTNLKGGMKHEDLNPEKFITGADLISLGMKPGPLFKGMLDRAENGQLTGHITSKAQALDLIRTSRL